jgi:hypothetical protein
MFFMKAVKMIDPSERKIDRKILGPMQAMRCGILDRYTAWRFTNCMMAIHNPKVVLAPQNLQWTGQQINGKIFRKVRS